MCVVTFNANNGSGDTDSQIITPSSATALKTRSTLGFTYEDHTFQGWSESATATSATYEDGESVTLTGNKNLYAVWGANSPQTPVISPGTGTYTSAQSVTITCATSGATIKYYLGDTEPATPSSYSSAININESTTLTAWAEKNGVSSARVTRTYTINLASTDHTITVTDDGHGTGTATPSIASSDAVINLSATPSTGYEFDRWTSTTNGIHFANYRSRNTTFAMVDENVTVKANFKAKSNPKKDDDDDDHHEESSSPSPEKPSWTPEKAAATIAAQKAQKQQAAATQLASIQTMLRTKTSDRAGTGRNVIDLDMTKVDILDPATVNLLLLNNRFAFNVKISVPGGLTTTIMIPANFNFRPFIKADGTMNIHEVLWWIISKKK